MWTIVMYNIIMRHQYDQQQFKIFLSGSKSRSMLCCPWSVCFHRLFPWETSGLPSLHRCKHNQLIISWLYLVVDTPAQIRGLNISESFAPAYLVENNSENSMKNGGESTKKSIILNPFHPSSQSLLEMCRGLPPLDPELPVLVPGDRFW